MLETFGLAFVEWLHDKVCRFDQFLAAWLELMDPGEDEE